MPPLIRRIKRFPLRCLNRIMRRSHQLSAQQIALPWNNRATTRSRFHRRLQTRCPSPLLHLMGHSNGLTGRTHHLALCRVRRRAQVHGIRSRAQCRRYNHGIDGSGDIRGQGIQIGDSGGGGRGRGVGVAQRTIHQVARNRSSRRRVVTVVQINIQGIGQSASPSDHGTINDVMVKIVISGCG